MNTIAIQYFKTSIGELVLGSINSHLCLLDFRYRKMRATVDQRLKNGLNATYKECDTTLLRATRSQIDAYLSGNRKRFELPFIVVGTHFQKQVWKGLQTIPYGTTSSYLELTSKLSYSPKAVRAVANANGANALALIIPCHRIIGSDGKMVGYGGGLPAKKRLLELEKTFTHNPNELPLWKS